jgi:hypothetical protein
MIHIADWWVSVCPHSNSLKVIQTQTRTCRYATFCALAGVDPTDTEAALWKLPPIDSVNVWPFLSGQEPASPRTNILVRADLMINGTYKVITGKQGFAGWAGPQYPNTTSKGHEVGSVAIDCTGGCLFDVESDPTEHNNLASSKPALLNALIALKAQLSKGIWPGATRKEVHVTLPGSSLLSDNDACNQTAYDKYGGFYGPYMEI